MKEGENQSDARVMDGARWQSEKKNMKQKKNIDINLEE